MNCRTRLFTASLICWLAFAAVAGLTLAGHAARFDRTGMLLMRSADGLRPLGPGWLTTAMLGLSLAGGSTGRLPLTALAGLVLAKGRHWRDLLAVALTAIPALLINAGFKLLFDRDRPGIVPHLAASEGHAFPSGHAFNSAACFLAIALALGSQATTRRGRAAILAPAITLIVASGISRVWVGVHWPSDVIAGWLGGSGWALLVRALLAGSEPASGR